MIRTVEKPYIELGRGNPYVGDEKHLQAITAQQVLPLFPFLKAIHVANERSLRMGSPDPKKIKAKIGMLRRAGVRDGVADWLIFNPSGPYYGLAVELKVKSRKGNMGTVKPTQEQFLLEWMQLGWMTAVVWNSAAFYDLLAWYTGHRGMSTEYGQQLVKEMQYLPPKMDVK